MAAPTFVGAGTGVVITTATGSVTCDAAGQASGDFIVLQVLRDGVGTIPTFTYNAGLSNLAGATSSMTAMTGQDVGSPAAAVMTWRVGRLNGGSPASVSLSGATDDLYCRFYVFRGVHTGSAITDVIENGTAGTFVGAPGTAAAIADVGVTTLGADRLAVQLVAVDDDNPVGPFTGMTGGIWTEAVAEFASATGTDGCIQLQIGYVGGSSIQSTGAVTLHSIGNDATTGARATKFVAPATGIITLCQVNLLALGAPTDDLIVEIRTNSGSNTPHAVTVVGTPVTLNVTSTTLATYTADVAAPVTSGSTYWIVVRRTGAIDAANYYRLETGSENTGIATQNTTTTAWTATAGVSYAHTLFVGATAAGTINGGTFTMAAADNWGVVGLALIPEPSGPATLTRSAALSVVGLIATVGRELLPRSAVLTATGAIAAAGFKVTPAVTYERAAAVAATGGIATVGRELLPRAAVVAATGQVQVAGVRIRVIARTAAISATGGIATVGRELLPRAAAIGATGGIATVGRELLARSAAITATGQIAAAGREQLARLVEFGALARVTASGVVEGPGAVTHSRSAALSATGLIATVGREQLSRAAALNATGAIVSISRRVVVRSAAIGAAGTVTATGQLKGAVTGSAALTAAGGIASVPQRRLGRSAAVTATGNVAAASRRDLVRAAVINAVAAIDLTAGGAFAHVDLDALAAINASGEKLWAARPPGYIDLPGVGLVTQPIRGSMAGAGAGRIDATARGRLATASRGAR